MDSIKTLIFKELRSFYKDEYDISDEELNKLIFHHPRGLRLSLTGFSKIRKIFTAYSFEIPEGLKSRHRIALSVLEYPYFMTPKRLVLFSGSDAMMVKLHGGIEGFLETCCQIDKY